MTENHSFSGRIRIALIVPLLLAAWLAGCASAPPGDQAGGSSSAASTRITDPRDPWEGYNRAMTRFNDAVDDAVLKPVATAYTNVVPHPVRTGVSNFFGNISDVWSFVNNVLQANPEGALYSFWRVAVNSTLGLGGILDPASDMRLYRHRKDFGLTLGRWGVPPGPYLVLPILGPSTVRDTVALPLDTWAWGEPVSHIRDVPARNSLFVLHFVDTRAQLLDATSLLNQAALDPYSFTRDAWLQKRRNDVFNGNPPPENSDDDAQDTTRYDEPEAGASSADGANAPEDAASQPQAAAPENGASETPAAVAPQSVASVAPDASAAEPAAPAASANANE